MKDEKVWCALCIDIPVMANQHSSSVNTPKGIESPMPSTVAPMLCTLTKEVPDSADFLYEIKWDGYRIISYARNGKVRMDSRSALDYTSKYPPVTTALKALQHDVVLDGEVVVFNAQGIPDFDAVQLYNGHDTALSYCVFDILWLDGYSLMELELVERKKILRQLVKGNKVLRYSESYDDGRALYKQMLEKNLEGIVAKKKNSPYGPGERGGNWLKTPTRKRQEFVIGGWAESDKARSFRSLLFGAYNNNKKLEWIGRSGGGYKEKEMPGILKQLKNLEIDGSPFVNAVLDTKGARMHWVKPQLVANFEFATWTKSGRIRKPATFLGFRKDKKASQVVREVPAELSTPEKLPAVKKTLGRKIPKKINTSHKSNWPLIEKEFRHEKQPFDLEGCTIELFDVGRELWKGVTKAGLIEYYHHVAEDMLPYIHDRPQSLHVKLYGPTERGVYVKDMEGRQPECANIFSDQRRHAAEGKRQIIDYLVCNNEATLLWMINIGCIDVNPWNSRISSPEKPDWIVIDLDPSEEKLTAKGLSRLRSTAMAAKEFCDSKKLQTFVKTSGKTGLHFLIPCSGWNNSEVRAMGEKICEQIQALVPGDATVNVSKDHREGKVFVDFSQNDYADTIAAPYSVRPYYIPLVSTPLEWKEISTRLDPQTFTMETVLKRLEKKGDLWQKILDRKIMVANNKILKII